MRLARNFLCALACIGVGASRIPLRAQSAFFVAETPVGEAAKSTEAVVKVQAGPAQPLTARWLDLKNLQYSSRYRDTKNWHGRTLFAFGQERYVAEGRLKFDAAGRFSLNFHGSSGRYFNWSFADMVGGQYKDSVVAARAYKTKQETADLKKAVALDPDGAVYSAGIPSRGGYFGARQLYLSVSPVKQMTMEYGSLPIEHGQGTEITSFDDDGYISGARLRFHDGKHLYFDTIAATWAYLGSPLTPNFFSRASDLKTVNYQQYLVGKSFGKHVAASTDFTATNRTYTMREAVMVKLPETKVKVIDTARLEFYQRSNDVAISGVNFAAGSGYAVTVEKMMAHRLNFITGYADIDERYAVYGGSIYLATVGFAWNGDAYETSKRSFSKAELKLGRGVTAFGFYTHTVVAPTIGHNLQGLTGGIVIDAKALANSRKTIF